MPKPKELAAPPTVTEVVLKFRDAIVALLELRHADWRMAQNAMLAVDAGLHMYRVCPNEAVAVLNQIDTMLKQMTPEAA
jgi:hypothetical protein